MNIRVIFGYLFFLLSVVFCAVQLVVLLGVDEMEWGRLALQFCSVFVCLALATQAAQSGHKTVLIAISLVAFMISFLTVLGGGILAIKGTSAITPVKFVIFLAYGGLYGCFGSVFSLVAGKSARTESGSKA